MSGPYAAGRAGRIPFAVTGTPARVEYAVDGDAPLDWHI